MIVVKRILLKSIQYHKSKQKILFSGSYLSVYLGTVNTVIYVANGYTIVRR